MLATMTSWRFTHSLSNYENRLSQLRGLHGTIHKLDIPQVHAALLRIFHRVRIR